MHSKDKLTSKKNISVLETIRLRHVSDVTDIIYYIMFGSKTMVCISTHVYVEQMLLRAMFLRALYEVKLDYTQTVKSNPVFTITNSPDTKAITKIWNKPVSIIKCMKYITRHDPLLSRITKLLKIF